MDNVLAEILKQYGGMGAIVIVLGSYLLKKEIAFAEERKAYVERENLRHTETIDMAKAVTSYMVEFTAKLERLEKVVCHEENRGPGK